jgi:NitT/TauT family transport system permease protein/taurine transport system permease protein
MAKSGPSSIERAAGVDGKAGAVAPVVRPVARPARARPAWTVRLVRYAISVAGTIVLWHLMSTYLINPQLLPSPAKVVRTAIPMLATAELLEHVAASMMRIAVGFSLGSVAGVFLGLLMGRLPLVSDLADPPTQLFRFLSPTAMIPLAIIWFGIGETSKYFLIFYATVFIVLVNTITGVHSTPRVRVRAALAMGATQPQIFLHIVLPSAMSHVVSGMRVALASAFMAIIPAEMLAAQSGLGYLLQQSGLLVQTDRIFVALAVIATLGFLSDLVFRFLTRRLLAAYIDVA